MICMVFVCEYLEGSWAFTLVFIVFVCEGLVGVSAMDPAPARLSVLGKERWIQRQLAPPLWGKERWIQRWASLFGSFRVPLGS